MSRLTLHWQSDSSFLLGFMKINPPLFPDVDYFNGFNYYSKSCNRNKLLGLKKKYGNLWREMGPT